MIRRHSGPSWQEQILGLREQVALLDEAPLSPA